MGTKTQEFTTTMTNEQVIGANNAGVKLLQNVNPNKFNYALSKNLDLLKPYVKAVEATKKPGSPYGDYLDAAKKIQVGGEKKIKALGSLDDPAKLEKETKIISKANAELEALKEANQEHIDKWKEEIFEANVEESIKFYPMNLKDFPETLKGEYQHAMRHFIPEPEPEA